MIFQLTVTARQIHLRSYKVGIINKWALAVEIGFYSSDPMRTYLKQYTWNHKRIVSEMPRFESKERNKLLNLIVSHNLVLECENI